MNYRKLKHGKNFTVTIHEESDFSYKLGLFNFMYNNHILWKYCLSLLYLLFKFVQSFSQNESAQNSHPLCFPIGVLLLQINLLWWHRMFFECLCFKSINTSPCHSLHCLFLHPESLTLNSRLMANLMFVSNQLLLGTYIITSSSQ